MKKSVYSLVLSDEIVDAVDILAYKNGTSRSAMVNSILANYVSYKTPEMRLGEIFKNIENILCVGDEFQILAPPSDTMLNLRSALAYKYNPTVRYSVQLYKTAGDEGIGELRVSMRTQNESLISGVQGFYRAWVAAEKEYLGDIEYKIERDRFFRKIYYKRENGIPAEQIISDYIKVFDKAMKEYFRRLDDPESARAAVRKIYKESFAEN
ncbi:MAG: hypothetical protein ACI3XF_00485 [Eubacteriales bacterium]